jgi:Mor family transcriptional regulator
MSPEQLAGLPQSMTQLVALIGLDAALALVNRWGGLTIEVPRGLGSGRVIEELRAVLGTEAANTFMQTFGGEDFYIPRCAQLLRDARDLSIQADYDAGTAVAELARKHHLSERSVWTTLKRDVRADARAVAAMQPSLFD